jgi:hypothetical protein
MLTPVPMLVDFEKQILYNAKYVEVFILPNTPHFIYLGAVIC